MPVNQTGWIKYFCRRTALNMKWAFEHIRLYLGILWAFIPNFWNTNTQTHIVFQYCIIMIRIRPLILCDVFLFSCEWSTTTLFYGRQYTYIIHVCIQDRHINLNSDLSRRSVYKNDKMNGTIECIFMYEIIHAIDLSPENGIFSPSNIDRSSC